MERYEALLPLGVASSVDRVRPPTTCNKAAKSTKRKRSPSENTTIPLRRSQRVGQGQRCNGQAPPNPDRLSTLPREVRDCIYDYAFRGASGTLIRFRHGNMKIGAAYGISKEKDIDHWEYLYNTMKNLKRGLPAWLRASKQILTEAVEHFHYHAEFFYINDDEHPLYKHLAPLGHLSLNRARTADLTAYVLPDMDIWEDHDEMGSKFYVFGLEQQDEAILQQAIYHLMDPSSAMQSLTIRLTIVDIYDIGGFDASIHDIRSRISFVDQLSRSMMKVKFVLGIKWGGNAVFERFLSAVKEEMRRIALLLVDNDGIRSEESEVCAIHESPDCMTCQAKLHHDDADRPYGIWRFEATSAVHRRALALGRI